MCFIGGLPLLLLVAAAACVFPLRHWRPGLGMVAVGLTVTSWASISTADQSAAPGFVLLYILMVAAYQLHTAGAWLTCGLATLAAGINVWVPLGPTYAARTMVTFWLLGATLTYLLTTARDRNEELIRQLQERVYRDPVSGVGSRLLFEEQGARHLAEGSTGAGRHGAAARGPRPLQDRQRRARSHHRRPVAAPRRTGLSAGARSDDVVCRLGGDEFAVLMPATTMDEATDHARSTVAALGRRPMPLPGGGMLAFTLSVGVGHCVSGSLDDLYADADASLYRAKGSGRATIGVPPEAPDDQHEQ